MAGCGARLSPMADDVDTLPAALYAAANRYRDRLAYAEGGRRVTWAALAQRAEDVAAGLISLGVQPGDRVAICAENSIDWITAYHGILRAGAIAVPVYFELRPSEIERQVRWAGCSLLFASPDVLGKLEADIDGVEHVIVLGEAVSEGMHDLDGLSSLTTAGSRTQLEAHRPAEDDTAVIVYTSGTTGGAKGVMLSHHNLVRNASASIEALGLAEDDSSLLVLPLHHALPLIAAIVLPPLIGAHFVIENDLRRIRDRLQEFRPTIVFGVPALYELIYRNVLARAEAEGRLKTLQRVQRVAGAIKRVIGVNLAPYAFRSVGKALGGRLKFLISGGAALNPQTVHDFSSLGLLLLQGWGMTEASPVIAVQPYSRRRFLLTNYYEKHAGSVGHAIPGVEVRLVDVPEKGIRVTDGGEGEVQVRGPNVFQGYWQAEDATRAAMDDSWLRTGDIGRIDAEGNVTLTGRSKYIIVLESGEKVHPDELEVLLSQSELLQDVCITGREVSGARGVRTHVTAIVYPSVEVAQSRSGNLDAESLHALVDAEIDVRCKQMTSYKRVTRIELVDTPLPKTALRKVARGSLLDAYAFDFETWVASGLEQ
jgi:long-chain acyl-CoA synthetase